MHVHQAIFALMKVKSRCVSRHINEKHLLPYKDAFRFFLRGKGKESDPTDASTNTSASALADTQPKHQPSL